MQLIALQYAPIWEDKASSQAHVEKLLVSAEPEPGALVVLPEMSDTGWSFNTAGITEGDTPGWASNVARRLGIHLQVGYAELNPDGKGLNCTVIAAPDGSVGEVYRKIHPFSFGRESDHFDGGSEIIVEQLPEAMVCPTICYDLRFPELYRHGAMAGAEIFTVMASWPRERAAHWRALVIARAIENQAWVVAVNRTGQDPSFSYAGGSLIVSPMGEIMAEGGASEEIVSASFDRTEMDNWRARFPALKDIRTALLGTPAFEPPES